MPVSHHTALLVALRSAHEAFQLHVVLPNQRLSHVEAETSLHEIVQRHHLESNNLEFRFRYMG